MSSRFIISLCVLSRRNFHFVSFRFISELGDTEERVEFFLFYFDEEAKEEYMVGAERKEVRRAGGGGNTRTFLEESLE